MNTITKQEDGLYINDQKVTLDDLQYTTGLSKSKIQEYIINTHQVKSCSRCKQCISIHHFHPNKKVKCGLNSQCKTCSNKTVVEFKKNKIKPYSIKEQLRTITVDTDTDYILTKTDNGFIITFNS